jgi:diguanylate cyclase (GGDEF)-like protein
LRQADVRATNLPLSLPGPLINAFGTRTDSSFREALLVCAHPDCEGRRLPAKSKRAVATRHFKNINDTHGHPAGDAVLKEVSRRMAGCVRPYDTVGRYGGEEFVVVAPSCDPSGAVVLTERILKALRSAPVETDRGPVSVTASCGIAVSNTTKPLDPQQLLHLADEALYRAKERGRDRSEFATEARMTSSR